MSNCSNVAPVNSLVKVPYGYHTRLPSVWRLGKSFPACHKECDVQLRSTVLCYGPFNKVGGGAANPQLSPDMVLFICFMSLLCPSVSCNQCVHWNMEFSSREPPAFILFTFLSCVPLFPQLSFIPMCREAWVMKSSLSVWLAHLCLPPPSPAASVPSQAFLTYKFCPSVTNECVV